MKSGGRDLAYTQVVKDEAVVFCNSLPEENKRTDGALYVYAMNGKIYYFYNLPDSPKSNSNQEIEVLEQGITAKYFQGEKGPGVTQLYTIIVKELETGTELNSNAALKKYRELFSYCCNNPNENKIKSFKNPKKDNTIININPAPVKSRLHTVKMDLSKSPGPYKDIETLGNVTINPGDINGEVLNLLNTFIYFGIIKDNPALYDELYTAHQKGDRDTFEILLDKLEFDSKLIAEKNLKFIFQDVFWDRGFDDLSTFKLLALADDYQVNYTLLSSDHDGEFQLAYENTLEDWRNNGDKNHAKWFVPVEGRISAEQSQSTKYLRKLLQEGSLSFEQLQALYDKTIKAHTKPFEADLTEEELKIHVHGNNHITVTEQAAKAFNQPYSLGSAQELAYSIERVNQAYQQYYAKFDRVSELQVEAPILVKANDTTTPHLQEQIEIFTPRNAMAFVMWGRHSRVTNDDPLLLEKLPYKVSMVFGHGMPDCFLNIMDDHESEDDVIMNLEGVHRKVAYSYDPNKNNLYFHNSLYHHLYCLNVSKIPVIKKALDDKVISIGAGNTKTISYEEMQSLLQEFPQMLINGGRELYTDKLLGKVVAGKREITGMVNFVISPQGPKLELTEALNDINPASKYDKTAEHKKVGKNDYTLHINKLNVHLQALDIDLNKPEDRRNVGAKEKDRTKVKNDDGFVLPFYKGTIKDYNYGGNSPISEDTIKSLQKTLRVYIDENNFLNYPINQKKSATVAYQDIITTRDNAIDKGQPLPKDLLQPLAHTIIASNSLMMYGTTPELIERTFPKPKKISILTQAGINLRCRKGITNAVDLGFVVGAKIGNDPGFYDLSTAKLTSKYFETLNSMIDTQVQAFWDFGDKKQPWVLTMLGTGAFCGESLKEEVRKAYAQAWVKAFLKTFAELSYHDVPKIYFAIEDSNERNILWSAIHQAEREHPKLANKLRKIEIVDNSLTAVTSRLVAPTIDFGNLNPVVYEPKILNAGDLLSVGGHGPFKPASALEESLWLRTLLASCQNTQLNPEAYKQDKTFLLTNSEIEISEPEIIYDFVTDENDDKKVNLTITSVPQNHIDELVAKLKSTGDWENYKWIYNPDDCSLNIPSPSDSNQCGVVFKHGFETGLSFESEKQRKQFTDIFGLEHNEHAVRLYKNSKNIFVTDSFIFISQLKKYVSIGNHSNIEKELAHKLIVSLHKRQLPRLTEEQKSILRNTEGILGNLYSKIHAALLNADIDSKANCIAPKDPHAAKAHSKSKLFQPVAAHSTTTTTTSETKKYIK